MDRTAKHRQGGLDGLRGLAALAVFAVHVWIYQLPNTVDLSRDNLGELILFEARVAFVMFFVLSGYLLFRPFVRGSLGISRPEAVVPYLVRRAARIMPAYYVALAGTLALLATAGDVPGKRVVDAHELPLFAVFAQNFSPETLLKLNAATWTLAVEVAFYVLLPLVALIALRACRGSMRRHVVLLLALVVGGIGWNLLDYAAGWGPVASHSAPSFLPYFACGMIVALLVERSRARALAPLTRRVSALVVAAAALVLVANGFWHVEANPNGLAIEAFADLPAAVAFSSLIAAMTLGTGSGLGWLGSRPLMWFGQISFGFYLWHIPLIVWTRGHGLLGAGAPADVALLLPAATALGAASWYLVERPLMRRASRLRRDAEPPRPSHRSQARTIALANPRP